MEIKQVTYIHNRHNENSRKLLAQIPSDIDIVDAYNGEQTAIPGMFSGYDWVTSGGTQKWRGLPAAVIIIPTYHVPEVTEAETVIPAYNVDSYQHVLEIQTSWQEVEEFVVFVNERAQQYPPLK